MRGWLLAALVLLAAGCASTMESVLASKADGLRGTYPVGQETAWGIAQDILYEAAGRNVELHRSRGYMCVEAGMKSEETVAAVWIEPAEKAGETLVTVVARRKVGLQFAKMITEEDFQARFAQRVEAIQEKSEAREKAVERKD